MNSERIELSKYRLEKAKEDYATAVFNCDNGFLKASLNRSYNSIFHATRAILALDAVDYKKY